MLLKLAVGRDRKLRNIGNEAREAGFSFKALSCTSFGFWDPVAEREIVKLCRAKSTRLGLSESKVVSSEFRLLSCALTPTFFLRGWYIE